MLEGDFHSLEVRAGGHVNPVLTVRALYEAGLRAGVEYRIGEMVVGFETSGETITAVRLAGWRTCVLGQCHCRRGYLGAAAL